MNWEWILSHLDLFAELTGKHLFLAVTPVLLALVVVVPVGILCAHRPRGYVILLGVTLVLYSIPSIAVVVVMVGFTGLSSTTVIVPLTLYAFAIMVRNVVDGIRGVPAGPKDSAAAMGFTPLRRTIVVDLPLAIPVIAAGVRIATVSSVSFVSISSLIGISSLGDLFINGFRRDFPTEIMVGLVLIIALATVLDFVVVMAQRLLTPWTHQQKKQKSTSARRERSLAWTSSSN